MLENFFISKVRIKILHLFFTNPQTQLHVRAITRQLNEEINAVRRELERMAQSNLLNSDKRGNRLFYYLNPKFPFYKEFSSLIQKEHGLGKKILKYAANIGQIKYVWLTKFYVKGLKKDGNDVDLVIVGDNIDFDNLAKYIKESETETQRLVNYTVMGTEEFILRKKRRDNFLLNLLLSSKLMLIGDEDELLS